MPAKSITRRRGGGGGGLTRRRGGVPAGSLPEPSADALRSLSRHLTTVREEERTRLSRALHDELGQMLTSLKLDLAWLAAEVTGRPPASPVPAARAKRRHARPPLELVNRLQAVVGLVDVTLATVRRISRDLRPPVLDHLGLADALRWEAAVFEARTGIRCRVTASAARLDDGCATVLFRILQEALTNVARHSHAGAVRIDLRVQRRLVRLTVRDNGRGITPAQARSPRSIGLLGMRERAVGAGGELSVRGIAGRGTTVIVSVPLAPLTR